MAADAPSEVAMVFCVEPGWLEPQARLLAASIRQFAGRFATSEIHAVQPRGGAPLSRATDKTFAELGVHHRPGRLNVRHGDIPTLNKAYAIAAIAETSRADFLAFLDTDSVVLNEPSAF